MTEPYNGILDNNRLVSSIADWLAIPVEEEEEAEDEAERDRLSRRISQPDYL